MVKRNMFLVFTLLFLTISSLFSEPKISNYSIVSNFINDDVLLNINTTELYDVDNVIDQLGKIVNENIEKANIKYEGLIINKVRNIEYDRFNAIIYMLDNGNEIFGYLKSKKDLSYSMFNHGTLLDDYIDLTGKSINKWNNSSYTIYGKYQSSCDANLFIKLNESKKIEEVIVNIGGV